MVIIRRFFFSLAESLSYEIHKRSQRLSQNVVIVMVEFALRLMRTLRAFNMENFLETNPGLLRIGISHGKVMAGVVGSSKPLYDVWGNAVNMASRMDSTGTPGRIQVTSETAKVLNSFGFKCDFRGDIMVKGRGLIPTYFMCIDDKLEFVRVKKDECQVEFVTKL
jgi:adenylate cyclase